MCDRDEIVHGLYEEAKSEILTIKCRFAPCLDARFADYAAIY